MDSALELLVVAVIVEALADQILRDAANEPGARILKITAVDVVADIADPGRRRQIWKAGADHRRRA